MSQYSSIRNKLSGLPSWVPDWSANFDETFRYNYIERIRRIHLYKASGDMKPIWNRLGDGRISTKAKVIGSISVITQGYPTPGSLLAGQALLDSWTDIFRCSRIQAGASDGEDESQKVNDFPFMISGDLSMMTWNDESGSTTAKHKEIFGHWCTWFSSNDPSTLTDEVRQHARQFDDMIKQVSLGRHMIKTSQGHVGFGPEGSREGDMVVIMPGGRMPYILRRCSEENGAESEYKLLGDVFLHGAMLGEALESTEESDGSGWKDIVLQ